MSEITEAVGTTAVVDGPTRSDMIQSAMAKAVDDLIAAHNAKWLAWRDRPDQNDGVEAPILRDEDIRDAKIAARSAAKTEFHAPKEAEPA